MRSAALRNLFAVPLAVGLLSAGSAAAHIAIYEATLTGEAEFPSPVDTDGAGTARITIDDHAMTMRVETSFSGLTGNVTIAHIHCCTAEPGVGGVGVASPVPSFPGFPAGGTSGSYGQTFDMTAAASYNPAFITANGGSIGAAFGALLSGIAGGNAYLNIHTSFVGSGEIRGFLAPVPEPETWALCLVGAGLVVAAVRRSRR